MPMILANMGEKDAPPFGIYCDESARMADLEFAHRWHKWCAIKKAPSVANAINKYFTYVTNHYYELDYPKEKITEHLEKAKEYFGKEYFEKSLSSQQ